MIRLPRDPGWHPLLALGMVILLATALGLLAHLWDRGYRPWCPCHTYYPTGDKR